MAHYCKPFLQDCIATIERNFKHAKGFPESMESFLLKCKTGVAGYPWPGEPFLATAGLPCQGVSEANLDRLPNDPRNLLFRIFFELVQHLQVPYVLVEEVVRGHTLILC